MNRLTLTVGAAALAAATLSLQTCLAFAQEGIAIPAAQVDAKADATHTAIFAGGCFWGVQGVFQHMKGVENAVSGYAGGDKDTAIYQMVGTGGTGHAEAVKVTYDPKELTYGQLLQVYFSVAHDPTQLDRQGPDTGTQYRSTVFPLDKEQAKATQAYIAQLDAAKVFSAPIATTIEEGKAFYPAEAYHQDYLTLNPDQPYIVYNDLPKIENLKRLFPSLFQDDPVLVSEASASN